MKKVASVIFLLVFLSPSYSYADSNLFYPCVFFRTGSMPEAVAIGDVNGDGRNDVVMTTSYYFTPETDYSLLVFLQNVSGWLDPPIIYPTGGNYSTPPVTVAIGDVNNDGGADVVIGNSGGVRGNSGLNIQVFLQNESGGLNPPITYPTPNSESIKIADLNNDGLLDVVGVGARTNSVDVFLQNKDGTLDPPITYSLNFSGPICTKVDTDDVNNDKLTDIIVMNWRNWDGNTIGVLHQEVDGIFSPPIHYYLNKPELAQGMGIEDVNGDNLLDIVVAYGGNQPNSGIGIFLQNSSGSMDPVVNYSSYDFPAPVAIADINHDGRSDIIVAHSGWMALGVYLQDASGTMMPEELYPLPYSDFKPQGVIAGDINSDGFNDVVIATPTGGLTVYYNRKGPAIPHLSVFPESVNFGSVFPNKTSSGSITLYNMGTGVVAIRSVEISGQNAADFELTQTCTSVDPGSSCHVLIKFTANAEGPKYATVTITSDDPSTPATSVELFAYVGRILFYPWVSYPPITHGEAVAIGDVNGDGRKDVAMTSSYYADPEDHYRLHVYLQNSSGQLELPLNYITNSSDGTTVYSPTSIAIGDLNNDGRADIVVGNTGLNIEVFLQNSSGGLDPGISYPTLNSFSVKIGDLNNDGLLDVVGIGSGANPVDVFLQNVNGSLNPPVSYNVAHSGQEVEIGDVNGDGLMDIILMSYQGIAILPQNNQGTFDAPVYYDLSSILFEYLNGIAVADINGDNLQDIIVSYGGNQPSSGIATLLQSDLGTFDWLISYGSYDIPGPIVAADINNDNRKDVLVAHEGWSALGVYIQEDLDFLMPEELYGIQYSSHLKPQGLDAGDINGDGFNDVVIADYNGLTVLYNIGTSCTPPSITSHPQSQTILAGQTVSMSVSASGTEPFSYQWYRGSSGDTSIPIGGVTSSEYTIPALTQTTSYWVRVTNFCGSANSNTATITVTPCTPPAIASHPQNQTIQIGQTATLSVTASGTTPLTYQWYQGPSGNTNMSTPVGTNSASYTTPVLTQTTSYWVRASNYCGYSDSSGAIITVTGIYVTSPNGGETLTAGSTQTIRWNYGGEPGSFAKIELLKAGVVTNTISYFTSIGSAGSGSYNWTIPSNQTSGSDYIIRITSATNSSYTDTSNGNFTIVGPPPPTISVTSPNGGESLTAGSTQTIRWTYGGNPGSFVKIELLKAEVFVSTISGFASMGSGGSGSYNWSIPSAQVSGSDYQIKVTSMNNASCTDMSDGKFTIVGPPPPTISVTSPNGRETLTAGSTQTIRWSYGGNPGSSVKIELFKTGVSVSTISGFASMGSGGSGSYNWSIPSTQTSGSDYQIKVTSMSNASCTDMSDGNFTIVGPPPPTISVTFPNGGESLTAGSTQTIRWSYGGNPGSFVKIELFKAGVSASTINGFASMGSGGNGSYNWSIPSTQTSGSDYQIKVTSMSNASCTDMSDGNFTIVGPPPPTISLTFPNGGESLTAGSTQTIRWSYEGNPGSFVKIELLKAGVVTTTISYFTSIGSAGSGSYNWSIPSTQVAGSDYQIKITSMSNNSYSDTSDRNFIISN